MAAHPNSLKLLFTGCLGAGKTTAIRVLSDIPVISTEAHLSEPHPPIAKSTTTVAMDYGQLTLKHTKLHLYGTPGQRRFDFMGDVLSEGADGLIILIAQHHPEPYAELEHFLKAHRSLVQRNAAVVGLTHVQARARPTVADFTARLTALGLTWPVQGVDARNKHDLLRLIQALLNQLPGR